MSSARHVVLNHIDSPLKILFWTKGEILLFVLPFFIGMLLDEFLGGVAIALFNAWGVSQYKKRFGKGKLQRVMYWYLPRNRRLKAVPPSFIREYVS